MDIGNGVRVRSYKGEGRTGGEGKGDRERGKRGERRKKGGGKKGERQSIFFYIFFI